jgi:CheY-like chemotaxis protein
MEGIAELLATRAHAKGIDIVVAIAADVPEIVQADPIRLRQVLTNLVGNAIKFTEDGGVLVTATVEQRSGGHHLHLAVRDTGVGVQPEKQALIFEDFVQADSSHARRFEGTGLGLSISKRLVEAMGGQIGVRNGAERGSIFWVMLPLDSTPRKDRLGALAGRRIALVSGSPILRQGLKLQLAASGADVVECADIEIVAGHKHNCDALILDAAMAQTDPFPNVNGLGIPSVALVPPQYRATLSVLKENGLSGYLTKPVRQSSLETRLKAVMSGETGFDTTPVQSAPERRAERRLSVLLAEDNPVNALLARELLRRRGHTVHDVSTGEAAVEACLKTRFDLVVMDLHMPGLDGIEATVRIRAAEKEAGSRPVPIFALTADALETGRRACLEAGMDGFLTKPVDPAELDSVLSTIHPGAAAAA